MAKGAAKQSAGKKKIWVISGTHWDREWRYSADQSLLRLAEIIDDLLVIMEKSDDFACFLLDGGTVVIEDYLAVRPENEQRLRKLMEQKRVFSVPWYTLPEMNTVAPEALVRNLLVGQRMSREFHSGMTTGYTATSYGQLSQLPQMYAGFGLDSALTYRGTNKFQVPPICEWEGADGTRIHHIRCFDEVTRTNWFFFVHYELVLGKRPRDIGIKYDKKNLPVHMADNPMYETAFQLLYEDHRFNTDPEQMRKSLKRLARQAEPQAIGPHLLALDMEDNASPYYNLPNLIDVLNDVQDEYQIVHASLEDYKKAALAAVKGKKIPVLKGEMRYTAIEVGFNALLGGTHSSRIKLKLLNHEAERELIAMAEPLQTLAALNGDEYRRSLLDRAWLELLKNHAHDSICGAAIHEAHEDMPYRFRAARSIAREVGRKACEHLWMKMNTAKVFKEDDLTLTFFNPTLNPRKAVIPIVVDTPLPDAEDVFVEACTGAGPIMDEEPDVLTYDQFDILDEKGKPIPYKVMEVERIHVEAERKLDSNAVAYQMDRRRLLIEAEAPAMGYRTVALRPRDRIYNPDPQPRGDRPMIALPGGVLQNENLKVQINANGTFDLTDLKSGKTIAGMHWFEDNGSVGNAHQVRQPMRDFTVTSLGCAPTITLLESNTLRGVYKIDLVLPIPADADIEKRNRGNNIVELLITTWLTLTRGSRRLEIKTQFDNAARDHRLRVMLPSDVQTDMVSAESAYDVIERCFLWKDVKDNFEGHHPFQPMQSFIDLSDGKNGVALLSKGLREYEVVDDPRRTMALTLMRSHRAYMLAAKEPLSPAEYEKHFSSHSLGVHEMEYAVMFHTGDWRKGKVLNEAADFNTPWRVLQGVPKPGELPVTLSMLSVAPAEHVHLSALCQADDGKGYILRLWNSSDKTVEAKIETQLPIKSMTKVRMDESKKLGQLDKQGKAYKLKLGRKEIATLRLQMR